MDCVQDEGVPCRALEREQRPARGPWGAPVGPWFRERPQLAVGVSLALFTVMCSAGLVSAAARDAAIVALVLPVSLLSVTFGRRGGAGGGLGVLVSLAVWEGSSGAVTGAAWAGALAIILLGLLLGSAIEELSASAQAARAADARRMRAESAARRLHEAAVVNDTMVQSVAVAKWALEAGDVARAVEVLEKAVDEGQRIVSDLLREATRTDAWWEAGRPTAY